MSGCGPCEGTGFMNLGEVPHEVVDRGMEAILKWMTAHPDSNVGICTCCGDGDGWYGEPGYHYSSQDPSGKNGPYAYNGGLAECH